MLELQKNVLEREERVQIGFSKIEMQKRELERQTVLLNVEKKTWNEANKNAVSDIEKLESYLQQATQKLEKVLICVF